MNIHTSTLPVSLSRNLRLPFRWKPRHFPNFRYPEAHTKRKEGSFGIAVILQIVFGAMTEMNDPWLDSFHWNSALISPVTATFFTPFFETTTLRAFFRLNLHPETAEAWLMTRNIQYYYGAP